MPLWAPVWGGWLGAPGLAGVCPGLPLPHSRPGGHRPAADTLPEHMVGAGVR